MFILLSDGRVVVNTDNIDYICPSDPAHSYSGSKSTIVMNSNNLVSVTEMPHEIYRIIERRTNNK